MKQFSRIWLVTIINQLVELQELETQQMLDLIMEQSIGLDKPQGQKINSTKFSKMTKSQKNSTLQV